MSIATGSSFALLDTVRSPAPPRLIAHLAQALQRLSSLTADGGEKVLLLEPNVDSGDGANVEFGDRAGESGGGGGGDGDGNTQGERGGSAEVGGVDGGSEGSKSAGAGATGAVGGGREVEGSSACAIDCLADPGLYRAITDAARALGGSVQ
eukprot:1249453-Pleurochrysis_carterae.AAC.1